MSSFWAAFFYFTDNSFVKPGYIATLKSIQGLLATDRQPFRDVFLQSPPPPESLIMSLEKSKFSGRKTRSRL